MSLTRNTLFALLMSLESDLRRVALRNIDAPTALTNEESVRAAARWRADRARGQLQPTPEELFDYLDLTELLDVLDRHRVVMSAAIGLNRDRYRNLVAPLRDLAPIRNRVCHARPLEPEDFASGWSVIESFSAAAPAGVAEDLRPPECESLRRQFTARARVPETPVDKDDEARTLEH
jgi:hypothetical protein